MLMSKGSHRRNENTKAVEKNYENIDWSGDLKEKKGYDLSDEWMRLQKEHPAIIPVEKINV